MNSDNNLSQSLPEMEGPVCPVPVHHHDTIVMGHGSGGRMTRDLIEDVFKPYISSPPLLAGNDFADVIASPSGGMGRLAISTDSHIVTPLFFPGGDIGRLAICGTVNDICMSGAIPLYLTAGFILEEGFSIDQLKRVLASMQTAANEAGIQVIAGDTKVVEKGKADGIFITTTGIGWIPADRNIRGDQAQPGDVVLISGSLGDHGIAVLAERGELGFSTNIISDMALLNSLIQDVLSAAPHTHVLRDPTRGGLATTLNEIALQSGVSMLIDEKSLPIQPGVRAACEMLGFDPLYVANEGKVIVITPADEAADALSAMRRHHYGRNAAQIGIVQPAPAGTVLLRTLIGGTRILDMLAGEMLPRIC